MRRTGQRLRRGAPLVSVYGEQLQTLQREYLLDLQVTEPTCRHLAEPTVQKLRLPGVSAAQLRPVAFVLINNILPVAKWWFTNY